MRLRMTCKCGAELEARGLAGTVGATMDGWREMHMVVCYGVDRVRLDEDGIWQVRPSPKLVAERLDADESEEET